MQFATMEKKTKKIYVKTGFLLNEVPIYMCKYKALKINKDVPINAAIESQT